MSFFKRLVASSEEVSPIEEATKELLVVQPRHTAERQLQEALRLARTYSGKHCKSMLVGRRSAFIPNPATYLGSGAVQELKTTGTFASEFFVNAILTGIQVRNLEQKLGVKVLDRILMIVSIFAQRAQTKEAKLQVDLACAQLARTRLIRILDASGRPAAFGSDGQSEVVSGRDRGRGERGTQGGMGGGGQGESEISLQRNRITRQITKLKHEIDSIKQSRAVQRQSRRRNSIPTIAVVGYTNAGKSTLVSALTKSQLECDDLYFKTLDPITRRFDLLRRRYCLLTDTVGFISDLPICLFAAFRATLEEATHADVILHVIDANAMDMKQQRLEVYKTLQEIGVSSNTLRHYTVEAFNKMDKLRRFDGRVLNVNASNDRRQLLVTSESIQHFDFNAWVESLKREEIGYTPNRVFISAQNGSGLRDLSIKLDDVLSIRCG